MTKKESKELNKIKKVYGEKFMHMCRELFPTILEQEGKLYQILTSTFSDNCKTLYEDITAEGLKYGFKEYIYSKLDTENLKEKVETEKTPYEILKEEGYELTECKTEEEIQKFQKYYKTGEKLCTFRENRLEKCIVFFAVRKDANLLKREDFKVPRREDEYGTSVMSIQFDKEKMCTVSIKNRYNHTVDNPDATYGNDLDRIAPGLAKSFEKLLKNEYGLELEYKNAEKFELPGYITANDGKIYQYNMEIYGKAYCPGNIIIEKGNIRNVGNPDEAILMDYFYLDNKAKEIKILDEKITDGFIDDLQEIEKIEVTKSKNENEDRKIKIYIKDKEQPVNIGIDKTNQIVKYENSNITEAGRNFLYGNIALKELKLNNLMKTNWNFLVNNQGLLELELPKLKYAGDNFLGRNVRLHKLTAPQLEETGDAFLKGNREIEKLELLKLRDVGDDFLATNQILSDLNLLNLRYAGNNFCQDNTELIKLQLPNLEKVGEQFFFINNKIIRVELPKLKKIGAFFLYDNRKISFLELPMAEYIGDYFLSTNKSLKVLAIPNVKEVETGFLASNKDLVEIIHPNLLESDSRLRKIVMENRRKMEKQYPRKRGVINNNETERETGYEEGR